MLSTVESLTLNPRLASAPTMRLLPQVGFSWSSLTTSFSSTASTRGRPAGLVLAKVHFLATKTRNQRRVSGVTSVANFPRRRRPTRLAFRASRIRWASVKRLGLLLHLHPPQRYRIHRGAYVSDTAELPEATILRLQPGDKILIQTDQCLSQKETERIVE